MPSWNPRALAKEVKKFSWEGAVLSCAVQLPCWSRGSGFRSDQKRKQRRLAKASINCCASECLQCNWHKAQRPVESRRLPKEDGTETMAHYRDVREWELEGRGLFESFQEQICWCGDLQWEWYFGRFWLRRFVWYGDHSPKGLTKLVWWAFKLTSLPLN